MARSGKSARFGVNTLDPQFEPAAKQLIDDACEGGDSFLRKFNSFSELAANKAQLREYLATVHRGFDRAQDEVFARLSKLHAISPRSRSPSQRGEEALLRKIMDAVAWQMIGRELYIARRLFRDASLPSLIDSSAESVMAVAKSMSGSTYERFGLVSDLTSFVQVGDILGSASDTARLSIIEVKSGAVNEKVLRISEDLGPRPSEQVLGEIRAREGDKIFEQLRRVQRQKEHNAAVVGILTNDRGFDPTLKSNVVISTPSYPIQLVDDKLDEIIGASHERGWAIQAVDECLFLGAYREVMKGPAPLVFRGWLDGMNAGPDSPILEFSSSLVDPLALPPFGRFIRREHSLDVVFGRCRVLFGVHLPRFVELIQEEGGTISFATKKQRAQYSYASSKPITLGGKVILVEKHGITSALHDGIYSRMVFHGQSPRSIARASVERPSFKPEGDAPDSDR